MFWAAALLASPLEFEATTLEHEAEFGEEAFVGTYRFVNNTSETVTIANVRSSCGCTVPELDKMSYAPGESGYINAIFTYGSRTGRQVKTVTVRFDEPASETVLLRMQVNIPQVLIIRPQVAMWRMGDEPTVRSMMVEVGVDADLDISIQKGVNGDQFDITIHEVEGHNGRLHEVRVTPKSMTSRVQSFFTINTEYPAGNPQEFRAFAIVR